MSSLLSLFANNLLPIFLSAGTGFVLGKALRIEARSLSRVIFYIFAPCLIFKLLTENQLSNGDILRMTGFSLIQMGLVGGLAWVTGWLLRFERRLHMAVVLTSLLPNAGNFGLSLNLFAFGESALAQASVYFVISAIVSHTVGVFIASLGRSTPKQALVGLLKIPTVYAIALAALFLRTGWQLPLPLERTTSVLADAAIPSMLVLLGLLLQGVNWTGHTRALTASTFLRLVVSPLIALGASLLLNLQGAALQAAVLEASTPTAVTSTVLASEFDVEPSFVTLVVFATTLLSPLTLTPLLAVLGG